MSGRSNEYSALQKADYRAWLKGRGKTVLVLPRTAGCQVCEVLFPSRLADAAFYLRWAAMWLIRLMPCRLKIRLYRLMGVKIGRGVCISPGAFLDPFYPWLIEIEDGAFLGLHCRIFTHEYTATHFRAAPVRIGEGSVIGAYSIIRGGVTLGRGVTTGFGSVVVKDVADGLTVGGVPARPLHGQHEAKVDVGGAAK